MINIIRTNSEDKDFLAIVKELDLDLSIRDGDDRAFYNQFNKLDKIKHVIIAYENDIPVGCGAIKEYNPDTMEIKRMYTPLNLRGRGIASQVLCELEKWTLELQYSKCILETGKRQPEAIALYIKNGYKLITNYGQYEKIENSVCFEKVLFNSLDDLKSSDEY